jgi:hypothetical protein
VFRTFGTADLIVTQKMPTASRRLSAEEEINSDGQLTLAIKSKGHFL